MYQLFWNAFMLPQFASLLWIMGKFIGQVLLSLRSFIRVKRTSSSHLKRFLNVQQQDTDQLQELQFICCGYSTIYLSIFSSHES